MKKIQKFIEIWKSAIMQPAKTFSSERRNADFKEGAWHVGLAGVITGFIAGLVALLFGTAVGGAIGSTIGIAAFVMGIVLTPIISVIMWLIGSGIIYIVAKLLGGKGDFKLQSYLFAIYMAPISIISTIIGVIPVVNMLGIVVTLYSLYLLTLAIKESHRFTTMKAVITWLIPAVLLMIVVLVLGAAFLAGLGLGGLSNLGI